MLMLEQGIMADLYWLVSHNIWIGVGVMNK